MTNRKWEARLRIPNFSGLPFSQRPLYPPAMRVPFVALLAVSVLSSSAATVREVAGMRRNHDAGSLHEAATARETVTDFTGPQVADQNARVSAPNGPLTPTAADAEAVEPQHSAPAGAISLTDRVRYQTAIEEVYWQHRIWPKERSGPKPVLSEVMSAAQIEKKVQNYLQNSEVLRRMAHQITAADLQAEMDRMAQHTKDPEMLHELFRALGNDPFVIAECLARQALSERLVTELRTNAESAGAPMQDGVAQLQFSDRAGGSDIATESCVSTRYSLPTVATGAEKFTENTWSPLTNVPGRRANQSAVWTGSEMIVWGGVNYDMPLGTGDRYNPATDTWSAVNLVHGPAARTRHSAVWTGTEMIVWGGFGPKGAVVSSGGKYNPGNDTWAATSVTNAPSARGWHTAVWTGAEMLVWGGTGARGFPSTGGRYDPETDSWRPTSATNAPEGRFQHTAVWSGTEMIVWGGEGDYYLKSGAKYNPASDSWTTVAAVNSPSARYGHSAVWTGSEMVVWGGWNGHSLHDGARYDPASNAWVRLNGINAPHGRYSHTAVWTGSEIIVWGGTVYPDGDGRSGGRYNPATNTWRRISLTKAPSPRDTHTAVWTGSEMIVFGGGYGETLNTGGRYDPEADSWASVRTTNTPDGRYLHTAVWTGTEMIVWGGGTNSFYSANTGGRYNPALDAWVPTSTAGAPHGRQDHTAVWTGTEMIVWGGWDSSFSVPIMNSGGRYNPARDSWSPTTLTNAPDPKRWHSAVWTGSEMIVWGGEEGADGVTNSGGRYDPDTDSWVATSATNAPAPRIYHTAIWTGGEMIVWGGGNYTASNTGGRYNPRTDTWTAMNTTGTQPRTGHTAIWTGTAMIVWGGYNGAVHVNTGARYNPSTNTWKPTTLSNAPDARGAHAAIWTGEEMIVWGGYSQQTARMLNTGGRYNPGTDSWTATSTIRAPHESEYPTAVWTGSRMIVWGGFAYSGTDQNLLSTGGAYAVAPPPGVHPVNLSTRLNVLTGDNVAIAGFIVGGTGTKNVLIRGIGPSLTPLGVPGVLADPVLALHTNNTQGADVIIATNDNWKINAQNGESQQAAIAATGIPPAKDAEAAILANLNPGSYTAVLSGKNNSTGNSLVEVYDLNGGSALLSNVSTRGFVGTGDQVMIGGLILGPAASGKATVVVRAIGPTLGQFGINNFLTDPTLELRNANGALIARNDDWQSDTDASKMPNNLTPANAKESALSRVLTSGNYTAIVRGKNNTTGVALVEVYYLP